MEDTGWRITFEFSSDLLVEIQLSSSESLSSVSSSSAIGNLQTKKQIETYLGSPKKISHKKYINTYIYRKVIRPSLVSHKEYLQDIKTNKDKQYAAFEMKAKNVVVKSKVQTKRGNRAGGVIVTVWFEVCYQNASNKISL